MNCISCILHFAQSDDLGNATAEERVRLPTYSLYTFLREKAGLYRRLQRLHQSLRSFCSFEPHGHRLSRWEAALGYLPLPGVKGQRVTDRIRRVYSIAGPISTKSASGCRTNIHFVYVPVDTIISSSTGRGRKTHILLLRADEETGTPFNYASL